MEQSYRPTKAYIDLEAIADNLTALKKAANGAQLIAVVKANGYGHGAVAVAKKALQTGVSLLAVATPDEALQLRAHGIQADILVLGASPIDFIPVAEASGIILTAVSADWVRMAAKEARQLRVHLKVDTGMGRLGIQLEEASAVFALLRNKPFRWEGLFTHFATADEKESPLLRLQAERFHQVVTELTDEDSVTVHAANSAAALIHPGLSFDAVRTGISIYGIAPSAYVEAEMKTVLKPALSLETELVHVKKVAAGTPLSYGATYRAEQDEWIGTLPIGYADGLVRGLQGQDVLVGGRRAPIVGRICMDQCMVRLPFEMPVGERVTLIGRQGSEGIRIEEWAERLGTIPYEIPCILTARIPRFIR